jgi:hypothetical protein
MQRHPDTLPAHVAVLSTRCPQVPILLSLNEEQVWQLVRALVEEPVAKGTTVFKKGDYADKFYIVEYGAFTCFTRERQQPWSVGVYVASHTAESSHGIAVSALHTSLPAWHPWHPASHHLLLNNCSCSQQRRAVSWRGWAPASALASWRC